MRSAGITVPVDSRLKFAALTTPVSPCSPSWMPIHLGCTSTSSISVPCLQPLFRIRSSSWACCKAILTGEAEQWEDEDMHILILLPLLPQSLHLSSRPHPTAAARPHTSRYDAQGAGRG